MLSPDGIFAVCENWLNNHRVWSGAQSAGLEIVCVWPVKGKVGKDPLFAIYTMKKAQSLNKFQSYESNNDEEKVKPAIGVRDKDGKWTEEYAEIMEAMSIPAVNL